MQTRAQNGWLLAATVLLSALQFGPAPRATAQDRTTYQWLDTKGEPLPFATDGEVLEFMRTARIAREENIGSGINQAVRMTLERDGVRAHAIFREVDRRERQSRVNKVIFQLFADSYLFEPAAYELSRLLGWSYVPPATLRTIRGRKGSLQIWVEETIDENGPDFDPPSPRDWSQQIGDMYFFDNLIFNIDRNAGNLLVGPGYRLWLIDHTRAFQFKFELLDDKVSRVRRSAYDNLMALSEQDLRDALGDYLTGAEMRGLYERREALKEHIESLAAERGEDVIFY